MGALFFPLLTLAVVNQYNLEKMSGYLEAEAKEKKDT